MPVPVSISAQSNTIARLIEEGTIGMTQAAKLMGTFRNGKPTCSTTITRWAQKGVRLSNGRIVKLEAYRLNGRLCTSRSAIIRFILAQNECPCPEPPAIEAISQAKNRSRAATAELDAALAAG
jgi:hypothetical protein